MKPLEGKQYAKGGEEGREEQMRREINHDPYIPHIIYKVNSKWIIDLYVKL